MSQTAKSFLLLPGLAEPVPMSSSLEELRDRLRHVETAEVRQVLHTADGSELIVLPGALTWYLTSEPRRGRAAGF